MQPPHPLQVRPSLPLHMLSNLEALPHYSVVFLWWLHYVCMTDYILAVGDQLNLQPLCPPQGLGAGIGVGLEVLAL